MNTVKSAYKAVIKILLVAPPVTHANKGWVSKKEKFFF